MERLERQAPASVMARLALERALPAQWIDEVFEAHRQRQYARTLLFSTVVELMTLGLRRSLHAVARQSGALPVSLAALYDKVSGTEPQVLRALVRGSTERLVPVMHSLERASSLAGWQLRVVDGNHLASSDKRLGALRQRRGAALPGLSLVAVTAVAEARRACALMVGHRPVSRWTCAHRIGLDARGQGLWPDPPARGAA